MLIIDENGTVQRVDDPPGHYDPPKWQEYNDLFDQMVQNDTGSTDEMREAYARYLEAAKKAR